MVKAACFNSHATAKHVESMWREIGGRTKYPVETNVVWLDLEGQGISLSRFNDIGKEEGLNLKGERLLVYYHIYQNEQEALGRLRWVFERAWAERGKKDSV